MAERKPVDKRPIKDLLTEKDAFLTTSERAYEYFLRHTKALITAVAVVAILVVASALYIKYQEDAELAAEEAFEKALEAASGQTDSEASINALEEVRRDYSGRKAARMASFTLVSLYSEKGEVAKALPLAENLLQTLTSGEISLKPLLLSTLGGLYESGGNPPLAIKTYETILAMTPLEPNLKQDVLSALARVHTAAGQKDEAAKYYQAILVEFPQSIKAYMANVKLAELKGEPVAFPLPAPLGTASAAPAATTPALADEPPVETPAPADEPVPDEGGAEAAAE